MAVEQNITAVQIALKSRLNSFTGLTDLVGGEIYATIAPERTRSPFVVYRETDEEKTSQFSSDGGPTTSFQEITVFATDFDSLVAVSVQLQKALNRFAGTENGVVVQAIFFDGMNDRFDEDDNFYQRIHNYIVHYEE